MNRIYRLKNLGCAHCASKMETAINKLDKVNSASISFMAQKLMVETDASDNELEILVDKITEIIKKIEPDCEVER